MRACVFFFNDTATTEIYTLSLHDALPIFAGDDEDPEGGDQELGEADPAQRASRGIRRGGRAGGRVVAGERGDQGRDRKSTRLNSSHANISYAVFCLKQKNKIDTVSSKSTC